MLLIVEKNLVGSDAVVSAVVLPECGPPTNMKTKRKEKCTNYNHLSKTAPYAKLLSNLTQFLASSLLRCSKPKSEGTKTCFRALPVIVTAVRVRRPPMVAFDFQGMTSCHSSIVTILLQMSTRIVVCLFVRECLSVCKNG